VDGSYFANTTFVINAPYLVPSPGGDYSQLIVTGAANTIDLSSANVTFLSAGGGEVPALPHVMTLIQNHTAASIVPFENLQQGATVTLGSGGESRTFIASYTGGESGKDLVLFDGSAPDIVYVHSSFTGLYAQPIEDADFGTDGDQPALIGVTAFATIEQALAAVSSSGTIIVNGGTYGESVTLDAQQTLRVTGPDVQQTVIINSLAASAGQSIIIQGESNLTIGDATDMSIGGAISGGGSLTKQGTGTLNLNGANSYSGLTTISAGTIRLGHNSALGSDRRGHRDRPRRNAGHQRAKHSGGSDHRGWYDHQHGRTAVERFAQRDPLGQCDLHQVRGAGIFGGAVGLWL
jgi:autotransporter-associated beta strand protein